MTEDNTGSASENGIGTFEDLIRFVESVVFILIPKADKQFKVTGEQNRKRLHLDIQFDTDEYVGLFFGYGMKNLEALLQIIRSQQVYPHDRYIQISVTRSDGESQTFLNKDVSKYRKSDASAAMKDGATEDEANEVARKLSDKRRLIRVSNSRPE